MIASGLANGLIGSDSLFAVRGPKYVNVLNPEFDRQRLLPVVDFPNDIVCYPVIESGHLMTTKFEGISRAKDARYRQCGQWHCRSRDAKLSDDCDVFRPAPATVLNQETQYSFSSHKTTGTEAYFRDHNICYFQQCESLLSGFRREYSGIGTSGSSSGLTYRKTQSLAHVFSLAVHRPELSASEQYERPSKPDKPPIGRRFLITFGCMVVGFVIDDSSSLRIRKLWPLTFTCFIGSLLLLWLSNFRWSWGWWL